MESVSVRSEKINVSAMILNQLCLFEREISAKNIDVSISHVEETAIATAIYSV